MIRSFTSFSTKELTEFNTVAKDTLIAAAHRSRLFKATNEKGNDVIKLIELIVKDAGWKVEYEVGPSAPSLLGGTDSLQGGLSPYDFLDSSKINFHNNYQKFLHTHKTFLHL